MQNLTRSASKVSQRCQPKLLFTKQINCFAVQEFDIKKNYYSTLGVQQNSSASDIKKAFYKLAKQYHPDVNKGAEAKFKEINEAYEVLGDASKKRNYDDMRKASTTSSSSSSYSSNPYGSSSYSNTSRSGQSGGYNPYANQSQGNTQGGYAYKDKNGHNYYAHTGNQQSGYYQYDEEMRKNFFKNFYNEQSKHFDEQMKYNQQKYGSKTASSNTQNAKNYEDFFSTVNSNYNGSSTNRYGNNNKTASNQGQDSYRAFQEDMYKKYKDEEYHRMEEMAKLRRQKEDEFMRDAEKKVQAFMGKVDGAKKFAKNLADNLQGFFKQK